MRRTFCLIAVAASLAVPSVAFAQSTNHDDAVKLFQEGKKLRDDGRCDLAIPKLEESRKKEESIGARYNLGICYEKTGNKKDALANYKKAEQIAKEKGDDRQREIGAQIRFFFEQTTHIKLALPQPTPPDLQVLVDGEPVPNEELEGIQYYFPPARRTTYELRVSAGGYEDWKQSIDSSTVDKKIAVTVVLKKRGEATVGQPQPRPVETRWGPFQFLGLGLIAVGAVGITYSSVQYASYRSDESNLLDKFTAADNAAKPCPSTSPPESVCGKNITTRDQLRAEYNANEEEAKSDRALLLTFAIGGALAIGGGVLLIVFGPRTEVSSTDPGATAKAQPRPTFRLVPAMGPRVQGLSLVGTF